jgi:hypothetical protein
MFMDSNQRLRTLGMRKTITTFAALVLAVGFGALQAKASATGSIGCGGGNGASAPCNGQGLGTVTQSGSLFSSTGIDVNITSVSGLPSLVAGLPVFTPNTDQFDLSFVNVGSTAGGTFNFSDLTEPGVLTVTGTAIWTGTPPTGLVGTLDFSWVATSYTFNYGGLSASGSINSAGTGSFVLDPGNVMSMTGTIGLPSIGGSGPSATPEPGTLLLLASGLAGIGFIGRKLVVCG